MKNKIRKYVEYIFRKKDIENKEEVIEEITANIFDRYLDLFEKYQDEEKAYVEAIKHVGDFSEFENETDDYKHQYKPDWTNLGMVIALVLGVSAVISMFFSSILAIILIILSITLYVSASNYLYHNAIYEFNNNKDVIKQDDALYKIIAPLKRLFVLWNLGISYLIAGLLTSIIQTIVTVNDPDAFTSIGQVISVYLLVFIIIFIILYAVLKKLYFHIVDRINDSLSSKINVNVAVKNYNFKPINLQKIFESIYKGLNNRFMPLIIAIIVNIAIETLSFERISFQSTYLSEIIYFSDLTGTIFTVVLGLRITLVLAGVMSLIFNKNVLKFITIIFGAALSIFVYISFDNKMSYYAVHGYKIGVATDGFFVFVAVTCFIYLVLLIGFKIISLFKKQ
ncbi:MAG: hypothetical protein RBQ97_05065 [Acholeplasma sp.]|nr:hypothetical protein [Acholeplasma sp.]